jgi:glycosyltransferase involved in cell wall biosynthesis
VTVPAEASSTASIVALIPGYNEAERIGDVVTGARAKLRVLVVDDGSTDDTGKVAVALGAQVLRQEPNQGKGAALRAGMRWALDHGCEAVVTLDADGQHDPGDISLFLDVFTERNADLTIGARDFSEIPMTRRIANTLGRWSFSWALGEEVLDNQSGFRLISRRMMEASLSSDESGFEFEVEMIVLCHRLGYVLEWVPIRTIYGTESSHINGFEHAINFASLVTRTRRATRESRAADSG